MHRLPVHDTARAAALRVVLGCDVEPRAQRDEASGKEEQVWNITSHCGEAGQMLESFSQGTLLAEHPFRACMLGIEAAKTLRLWLREGYGAPTTRREHGGRLVRMDLSGGPCDLRPADVTRSEAVELRSPEETARQERAALHRALQPLGTPLPLFPHHFAAAAIVCGCLPVALTGPDAAPVLHLTAESVTLPALTLEQLGAAATGLVPLTDAEHPFHYAVEAIRTEAGFRYAAEAIFAKNPVHFYRGEGFSNPHTALVSEALLKSKHKLHTGKHYRDHLLEHLAGV